MAKKVKPMTKAEMLASLAETTGFTKVQVEETYNAILKLVAAETKKAGVLSLHGLGKFAVVKRKARMGQNPATKEKIKIPAKSTVKFTVSKMIKDQVLGK